MSIEFNDNIRLNAGKPIDAKYLNSGNTTFSSINEVNLTIPMPERYLGLTVLINTGATNTEYWYKEGVQDIDLIEKKFESEQDLNEYITGATNLGYFSGQTGIQSLDLSGSGFGSNVGEYLSELNWYYVDASNIIRIGAPDNNSPFRRAYVNAARTKSWVWSVANSQWMISLNDVINNVGNPANITSHTGYIFTGATWSGSVGTATASVTATGSLTTGNEITIGNPIYSFKEYQDLHLRTILNDTPEYLKIENDDYYIRFSGASSVLGGTNVGSGTTLFSGISGSSMIFNTLVGSGGTLITKVGDDIIIHTADVTGGTVSTGSSLGGGSTVFNGISGDTIYFNTLVGSGGTTITQVGNEIIIQGGSENSITGVTNGLTKVGSQDVVLGGDLTNDTTINGSGNSFNFTNLSEFNIEFSGTSIITDNRGTPRGLEYADDYSGTFNDNSLVTKKYVDLAATGLHVITAAEVATTGNTVLSGLITIDGVTLTTGDRVLVKDQTNPIENGIYSASTGAWGRTSDFNGTGVTQGTLIPVISGVTWNTSLWVLVTEDPITVGTTPLEFTYFSSAINYIGGNGINVSGTTISIEDSISNIINNSITGVTNGLTKVGSHDVVLGGTLTGNTNITFSTGTTFIIGNSSEANITICGGTGGTSGVYLNSNDSNNILGVGDNGVGMSSYNMCVDICGTANNFVISDGSTSSSVFFSGRTFQYGGDYSSYFQPNTLVTKQYVDDLVISGNTGGTGTISGAVNLGTGFPIFQTITGGTTMVFNTISGGTGVSLSCVDNNIVITAIGGTGTLTDGCNLGGANEIFKCVNGDTSYYRTIAAGCGTSIVCQNDKIYINSIAGTGSINTGCTLGTGTSVFNTVTGDTMLYNSIVGTGSVNVSLNGNEVVINGTLAGGGTICCGANLGVCNSGAPVFNPIPSTGDTLYFRRIHGLGGITINYDCDDIFISGGTVTGTTGCCVTGGTNVGTGATVYNTITGTSLVFNTLVGSGITTVTNVGSEIIIHTPSGGTGTLTDGCNLGGGYEVFECAVGDTMYFNTLVPSGGTTISSVGNCLIINSDVVGTIVGGANLGTGTTIFDATTSTGDTLYFNTLVGSGGTTISKVGDEIIIQGGGGRINDGENLPFSGSTGNTATVLDVNQSSTGDTLYFRGIRGVDGITVLEDCDEIIISASGITSGLTCCVTGGTNIGAGANVYVTVTGTSLVFNTLIGSGATTVTNNGNGEVVINTDYGITGATNFGSGVPIFSGITDNNLYFNSLVGSGGTTITKVGDEIIVFSSAVTSTDIYADNGLTKVGNTIVLGGSLTGNTNIELGLYGISFATSSNFGGGRSSFIGGGEYNSICDNNSAIIGGEYNSVQSQLSTILGGGNNITSSSYSSIVGGSYNRLCSGNNGSVILGGGSNTLCSGNTSSVILGGSSINVPASTLPSHAIVPNLAIWNTPESGSTDNLVLVWDSADKKVKTIQQSGITGTTVYADNGLTKVNDTIILGGNLTGDTIVETNNSNISFANSSPILAGTNSAIIGGNLNCIYNNLSGILGGYSNVTFGSSSTILGGFNNTTFGDFSSILGGCNNSLCTGNDYSVILGGNNITVSASTLPNYAITPNLAIWNSPNIGNPSDGALVWSSTDKKVKIVPQTGGTPVITGTTAAANGVCIDGDYVVMGGWFTGDTNINSNDYSLTISCSSSATGNNSAIIGGNFNQIYDSNNSFIGGGYLSAIYNNFSTIIGGRNNTIYSRYSGIFAGCNNVNFSSSSAIIGGSLNELGSGNTDSVILGGCLITIPDFTLPNYAIVPNLAIWETPSSGNTTDLALVWDNVSKEVKAVSQITGGTSVGVYACNGLTMGRPDTTILGGTLTGDTTVCIPVAGSGQTISFTMGDTTCNEAMFFIESGDNGRLELFQEDNSIVVDSDSVRTYSDLTYICNTTYGSCVLYSGYTFQYGGDYEPYFLPRTLVTKQYVDGIAFSGGSSGGTSGGNLGTGSTVFNSTLSTGNTLYFNTLVGSGGTTITQVGNEIIIQGGSENYAVNGLTKSGDTIVLGGNLTGNTNIETQGYGITISSGSTTCNNNSVVFGGIENCAFGEVSAILGGINNLANNKASTVIGGCLNVASGVAGTIVGGFLNTLTGENSGILGGQLNNVCSSRSGSIGGFNNELGVGNNCSVILGGCDINVSASCLPNHAIVPNLAIWETPSTGSYTDLSLVWDSTDKKVKAVPQSSGVTGGSNTVNVCNVTSNYTITQYDEFIGVSGATLICLPTPPKPCQKITVADISGNALSLPITICSASLSINGSSTATIDTDYGSVSLINNGYFWSAVAFIN